MSATLTKTSLERFVGLPAAWELSDEAGVFATGTTQGISVHFAYEHSPLCRALLSREVNPCSCGLPHRRALLVLRDGKEVFRCSEPIPTLWPGDNFELTLS